MGIGLMEAVWTQSEAEDSYRLLLVAIANNANEDSRVGWPGIAYLSARIRKSERQTQRLIHDLAETDDLAVEWGVGRGNPNIYHVLTGLTPQEKAERKEIVARINEGLEASEARAYILKGDTSRHLKVHPTIAKKVTPARKKGDTDAIKGDIETPKGDTAMSTEPSIKPSIKPSVEPSESAPPVKSSTPHQALVGMIAKASYLDLGVTRNKGRVVKAAGELGHIGATPEQIERYYVGLESWWFTRCDHWAARKRQRPTPEFICETWGWWNTDIPVNGNGHARAAPPPQEDGIAALRARLTGQAPTDGNVIEGRFRHG